jgi:hypothetical protein
MPTPCQSFLDNFLFNLNNQVGKAEEALAIANRYGELANSIINQIGASLEDPNFLVNELLNAMPTTLIPPIPTVDDIVNCPAAKCFIPGASALVGLSPEDARVLAQTLLDDFIVNQRANINSAASKALVNMLKTPLGVLFSLQQSLNLSLKAIGASPDITNKFSSLVNCMQLNNPAMLQGINLENLNTLSSIVNQPIVPGMSNAISQAQTQFTNIKAQHISQVL